MRYFPFGCPMISIRRTSCGLSFTKVISCFQIFKQGIEVFVLVISWNEKFGLLNKQILLCYNSVTDEFVDLSFGKGINLDFNSLQATIYEEILVSVIRASLALLLTKLLSNYIYVLLRASLALLNFTHSTFFWNSLDSTAPNG